MLKRSPVQGIEGLMISSAQCPQWPQIGVNGLLVQKIVEGKFPVNPGDELCPTPGHQQFVEEREPCNTHVCPVDCKWYPWGRWAACTQTCRTGQKMGTKIRTRKVKVQAKGTGAKCGSNSEESVPCGKFPECPVDGIWSNWTLSGECWNAQVIFGCQHTKCNFPV